MMISTAFIHIEMLAEQCLPLVREIIECIDNQDFVVCGEKLDQLAAHMQIQLAISELNSNDIITIN